MPIVQMPDGKVIQFPDSMGEGEIAAAIGAMPEYGGGTGGAGGPSSIRLDW